MRKYYLPNLLMIVCVVITSVYAQQQQQPAPPKELEYVDHNQFKGRIIPVQHRSPQELTTVISPLASGAKGALIKADNEFKTITVRDYPENIAAIEEAIKRLDVPGSAKAKVEAPSGVELTMYVLIASNDELATTPPLPPLITDVVKKVQETFSYKTYYLLTPIIQRTNWQGVTQGGGIATYRVPAAEKSTSLGYDYTIERISATTNDGKTDYSQMTLNRLQFKLSNQSSNDERSYLGSASIFSTLVVRDGEKLVVGTASLKDRAMILIVTAKTTK